MDPQEIELESLSAIFMDDMEILQNPWKARDLILLSRNYPVKDYPTVELNAMIDVSEKKMQRMYAVVEDRISVLKGSEMIFDIVESVRDVLLQERQSNNVSFYDEMVQRTLENEKQEELEMQQLALERQMRDDQERQKLISELDSKIRLEEEIKDEMMREQQRRKNVPVVESTEAMIHFPEKVVIPQKGSFVEAAYVLRGPLIGQGDLGATYMGFINNGKVVVTIKEIPIKNSYYFTTNGIKRVQDVLEEIKKLKNFGHPKFVKFYDAALVDVSSDMKKIVILLEFVQGCSLGTLIDSSGFSMEKTIDLFLKITKSIRYLHEKELYHANIKIDSFIFKNNGELMISDAYYMKKIKELNKYYEFGQSIQNAPSDATFSLNEKSLDIYDLGILFLKLIFGESIHVENCLEILKEKDEECFDFANFLLVKNKEATLDDVVEHSFFKSKSKHLAIPIEIKSMKSLMFDNKNVKSVNVDVNSATVSTTSRFKSDFDEIELLGRGGFGEVVKVRNKLDGRYYAVKRIKLSSGDGELNKKILREVSSLSRLHHEHVVRYYQAWLEDGHSWESESYNFDSESLYSESSESESWALHDDDWLSGQKSTVTSRHSPIGSTSTSSSNISAQRIEYLYIQMEYCSNKTLKDAIKEGIDLKTAWTWLRQIVEGIVHVHEQGLIHRDIKPSNIFFDNNGLVKLGDFGLSTTTELTRLETKDFIKSFQNHSLTSEIGTPFYIAPEQLSGGKYGQKVDMYSLDLRRPEIIFPSNFPGNLVLERKVISQLLNHNVKERPSSHDVLKAEW
ncbi:kinase-like protein [Rozella allomycis CSF55]|uniref:Kinase-like protein n=1 Tax=Rozella allomycis (strain CSF55) TaxID=988480 RepID=A0A4P9YIA7_ROZAC|nr:kinase-like protein [Rozella allomycis CSF55]